MQNCYDCANLMARIPLKKKQKIIFKDEVYQGKKGFKIMDAKFKFRHTTAYCKEGLIANFSGTPKIFQNVLRPEACKNKSFKQAEKCPGFISMNEE